MKKYLFCFFLLYNVQNSAAQSLDQYTLEFHPVYNNADLILNDSYHKLNNSDSIQFETMKFYISAIELLNNYNIAWKEQNSFHLVDASDINTLMIALNTKSKINFNQIKFDLGIDSTTNVSGAMGGDLDPTRGMYWTWQSGYINFKLEGKSNQCNTRNNEFQFHLGGYLYPGYALQTIILDAYPKEKTEIVFDLEKLISGIDLSKQNQIMSPGKDAVLLSDKVAKCFSIKQP